MKLKKEWIQIKERKKERKKEKKQANEKKKRKKENYRSQKRKVVAAETNILIKLQTFYNT